MSARPTSAKRRPCVSYTMQCSIFWQYHAQRLYLFRYFLPILPSLGNLMNAYFLQLRNFMTTKKTKFPGGMHSYHYAEVSRVLKNSGWTKRQNANECKKSMNTKWKLQVTRIPKKCIAIFENPQKGRRKFKYNDGDSCSGSGSQPSSGMECDQSYEDIRSLEVKMTGYIKGNEHCENWDLFCESLSGRFHSIYKTLCTART